jgi:tetratricopeptide (TPR) repeat protein
MAALFTSEAGGVSSTWRLPRRRNAVAALILLLACAAFSGSRAQPQDAVLIDKAAACGRYLPDRAAAAALRLLEQCISALQTMQKEAANDQRDAKILALIDQGNKDEAEKLQVEAAQNDEAAGIAKTKKAAERYRGIAATVGLANPYKAREYYAKAVKLDPDNVHGRFWDGYMEQAAGNLAKAESAYNFVLSAGAKGKDDYDLYWANLCLGDIRAARGDLPEALAAYQGASAAADRLAKAGPDNSWQRDLALAYESAGEVLAAQGKLPEALKSFRDALTIVDRITQADPSNLEWQRHLSVLFDKAGDVLAAQNNLPEALTSFRDGLAIARRLADARLGNVQLQRDLLVSYGKVGDVLLAQGNLPEALQSFRNGLALREWLIEADHYNFPNAVWQRDLAVIHAKLAETYRRQGEADKAKDELAAGKAIMARMTKLSPDNAAWNRELTWFEDQIRALEKSQR